VWPGCRISTGHKRRSITGTFLSTGDSRTDEQNPFLLKRLGSSVSILVLRVSSINYDISILQERQDLVNEIINRLSSYNPMKQSQQVFLSKSLGLRLIVTISSHRKTTSYIRNYVLFFQQKACKSLMSALYYMIIRDTKEQ